MANLYVWSEPKIAKFKKVRKEKTIVFKSKHTKVLSQKCSLVGLLPKSHIRDKKAVSNASVPQNLQRIVKGSMSAANLHMTWYKTWKASLRDGNEQKYQI